MTLSKSKKVLDGRNHMDKNCILAVVGPTGGGKSALALKLCERLDGELISCDSMQIYRRMDVGTAKPTAEEQRRVKHHLIDIVEPTEPFSVSDYVQLARVAIEDCVRRGKLPVICGGTGLYLDARLRKNDFEPNTTDDSIRKELTQRYEREGADALWNELNEIDPESAALTHKNNAKRVIRALEIYRVSGRKKSELDLESRQGGMRYDAFVIGLEYSNREKLYERINDRVTQMLDDGLVDETRRLIDEGVFEKNATAAQAIGYKELFPYFEGHATLEKAAEDLRTATRRYAKRQMTWFSAKDYVKWIEADEKTFEDIVNNAVELFKRS